MRLLLLFTCTSLCTSCIAPRGEGLNYIGYYLLFLAPILLFKAIYLVSKEKYINKKLKSSYRGFNYKRYRTVIVAVSSVLISIIVVNLIPSKSYDSPYEQFKYEIRAKRHQEAFNTYRRHLTKTEDNLAFLKACYTFINNENIPSLEDFAYYVEDFEEKSWIINQHTYFRLALIGLMNKNHSRFWKGIDHLTENDKGYHFLNGIYHRNNKNYRKAQISYEASIRKGEMKEEALKELSELHYYIHDKQSLLKLIELDPEIETISPSVAREYFYQTQDWPKYYKAMLRQYFANINFFGMLGGSIIALC